MRTLIFTVLLLGIYGTCFAQEGPRLSLSFTNQQNALPFTRIGPVHPGFELAYQPTQNQTSYGSAGWAFALGAFHHGFPADGIYVRAARQWTWKTGSFLDLTGSAGLGYLHTFTTEPVYWQNEAGEYVEKARWGKPHLMPEVGVQATLFPNKRLSPFVSYRFAVETFYSHFLFVLPHNFYGFGLTYQLTQK
ncbi:MAG: hypothetical protein AAFQ83_04825 [Bacteroidota bacterium]